MLVLEEYEHALARGANIIAELVGFGATSDGFDMVAPSGEGAIRCMQQAMETVDGPIEYVNTHGTSTPVGDLKELEALKAVFKDKMPYISATKALSGHALGAAGVHEAIYSLIMMKEKFLVASANIKELDPAAIGLPILMENLSQSVKTMMSNSFGFGGTNATLVFQDI
ncbi:MAG: 3-oxoacyl-[acyl-carrier-protein] synthase-1 [Arenicella sp.]